MEELIKAIACGWNSISPLGKKQRNENDNTHLALPFFSIFIQFKTLAHKDGTTYIQGVHSG